MTCYWNTYVYLRQYIVQVIVLQFFYIHGFLAIN